MSLGPELRCMCISNPIISKESGITGRLRGIRIQLLGGGGRGRE